ncbi:hypothetical protein TWF481_003001 [Arthrobotrys musiformis]|uniref:Uncharacterized protein n=1 Tax=Arthrobotrys musiformis TaxID=47236 RepID=A0AAV9VTU2_9PEZI
MRWRICISIWQENKWRQSRLNTPTGDLGTGTEAPMGAPPAVVDSRVGTLLYGTDTEDAGPQSFVAKKRKATKPATARAARKRTEELASMIEQALAGSAEASAPSSSDSTMDEAPPKITNPSQYQNLDIPKFKKANKVDLSHLIDEVTGSRKIKGAKDGIKFDVMEEMRKTKWEIDLIDLVQLSPAVRAIVCDAFGIIRAPKAKKPKVAAKGALPMGCCFGLWPGKGFRFRRY